MDRGRVTIQEAARRLGVSEGAVRKRVTRGTLRHDKEPDGRIYVYLDVRDRRGVDDGQDEGVDPHNTVLISRLEGEVEFLRDQVRRQQEIIAQQAVTMRQLTAASEEPAEVAEPVEEAPDSQGPPEEAQAGEEAAQAGDTTGEGYDTPATPGGDTRPWWRRLFG